MTDKYKSEVRERFGNTDAYREYTEKTKNCTSEARSRANDGLMEIFSEFAYCLTRGVEPLSEEAQSLVAKLRCHITENFYTCTTEILAGLGKMYVADERFRENIDKYGDGTAKFASEAIEIFCEGR